MELKFFKGALPTEGVVVGSIWFDSANGLIKVCTKVEEGVYTWENYSGVQDIDYANQTLSFTKADGTVETLSFEDVASKSALETLSNTVTGLGTSLGTAEGKITAIETVLNGEGENAGLVADVAANKAAVATVDSRIEAAVKVETDARVEAVNGLQDAIDAVEETVESHSTDLATIKAVVGLGGESGENKTIDELIDEKVGALEDTLTPLINGKVDAETYATDKKALKDEIAAEAVTARANEKANADAIAAEKARVDALIGSDVPAEGEEQLSIRDIVIDEVATQLTSENISESFDTLKEMAEWLSDHPADVQEMNDAINANTTAIATLNGTAETAGSVAKAVADAKAEVLEVITENEEVTAAALTDLDVRVDALDGQVKAIEDVNASDRLDALETAVETTLPAAISTAKSEAISEAGSAADTKISTAIATLDLPNTYEAKGAADALETKLTGEGGAITVNAAGVAANAAAIESLQTAVANVMTWASFN
jgi:hypothetical protein